MIISGGLGTKIKQSSSTSVGGNIPGMSSHDPFNILASSNDR